MTFKIVSVGWSCADFLEQTLASVEAQRCDDWDIWITYDRSDDDGAKRIRDWCRARRGRGDLRWNFTLNEDQRFAPRNQYEAIQRLQPDDDDIVVFLDLDGDRLAHSTVLDRLKVHYSDGTLLTYGNYRPVPFAATCPPAIPFPAYVSERSMYREFMLSGPCSFNHLRTMKGIVANNIGQSEFIWPDGPLTGSWYEGGTDYIFMVAGLELAGGKYKCIPEVLLLYNNANPLADYLYHPGQSDASVQSYLRRTPLAALP